MLPITRRRPIAEINIVPFTDVCLVLLIIFMIAAPAMQFSWLDVELPTAAAPDHAPAKPVVIGVTQEGIARIGTDEFNVMQDADLLRLRETLARMISQTPDQPLLIHADKRCVYDAVVRVLNQINQAGGKQLLLGITRE